MTLMHDDAIIQQIMNEDLQMRSSHHLPPPLNRLDMLGDWQWPTRRSIDHGIDDTSWDFFCTIPYDRAVKGQVVTERGHNFKSTTIRVPLELQEMRISCPVHCSNWQQLQNTVLLLAGMRADIVADSQRRETGRNYWICTANRRTRIADRWRVGVGWLRMI